MRRALTSLPTAALAAVGLTLAGNPGHAQGMLPECGSRTFSEVFAPNFTCRDQDKIYSGFSISYDGPAGNQFAPTDAINFSAIGDFHAVNFLASPTAPVFVTQSGNINYTISIDNTLTPNFKQFTLVETDIDGGTGVGITKTVTPLDGPLAGIPYAVTISSPKSFLESDNVTSLFVNDRFTVPNAQTPIFSLSNRFFQTPDPIPEVPAPLPILGGGVAFGFSRKLRSRIRKATAAS